MNRALLLLTWLLFAFVSFAQKTGTIKGMVLDAATTQPLPRATVTVSTVKGSLPLTSSLTSDSGHFEVRNLDSGTYRLLISYQGYDPYTRTISISSNGITDLNILKLGKAYKTLAEVVVKDKTPVRIKGDTVAYNADAYKTRPNATAGDLLKKLPGVQVDRSGAVSAQGESVRKVYVDGKEYLGDDVEQATRNLTADMIEQVQVFDDRSEAAKFSGVDDGSRSKAINLKLKKEAKRGLTGRVYAGHGAGGPYTAGMRSNYFKGASQLALIASTNNINRDGYTASDLAGAGMGASGLTRASSLGLSYRDTWSKRIDVNGSYSFSRRANSNLRQSIRQTFLPNATLLTNRQSDNNHVNTSHRFTQKIVYSIDSLNSVIYMPSLSLQRSRSATVDTLTEFMDDSLAAYKRSNNRTLNDLDGQGYYLSHQIIWRRKFNRPGRTFSASVNSTRSTDENKGLNRINAWYYDPGGNPYQPRYTDYRTAGKNGSGNNTLYLSYTEPLSPTSILELNYSNNRSKWSSDRSTYEFNPLSNLYDALNDSLTNSFEQLTTYNQAGANFREVKKKYNYQLGLSVQQSQVTGTNISNKTNVSQRYTNIIPKISFNYQLARNKSLRMAYRGINNQPTIEQLQEVADISNYPYIRRGNPGLRQEFMHNLMINYSFFNTRKFRNVFASLFYMGTQNKIVNSLQLNDGEQVLTPVNVRGTYSVNGSFGYSLPIKRMEGGHLSTTTRLGYGQMPGLVNGDRNIAKSLRLGEEIGLRFTYEEDLDLNVRAGINLNSVKHTIQNAQNSTFLSHDYALDAAYTFPHHLMVASTFDFTGYSGGDIAPGDNFLMWNVSLSRPVLKNNRGELTLSINNLLNQSDNFMRNVYENVIEDVYNQTQKRYALLTFTYHFNGLKGK